MTLIREQGEPEVAFSARVRRLQDTAIVRTARELLATDGKDGPVNALVFIYGRVEGR